MFCVDSLETGPAVGQIKSRDICAANLRGCVSVSECSQLCLSSSDADTGAGLKTSLGALTADVFHNGCRPHLTLAAE